MTGFKKWFGLSILSISIIGLSSWGFLVHKTIHQLAVYQLPSTVAPFFYANMDKLVYDAARPDIRRNTDSTEATKHFIDIEAFGENAIRKMPLEWDAAIKVYAKDSLLKYGYVPYQVIFTQDKLVEAFKMKNKDSIVFYAADLGHYIGDAHVPLHTTLNYDGQLTNQKGLHSLWESMIPELEIGNYNLFTKHKAKYLNNPALAIWKAVRNANALLPEMLAKEKEVTLQFTDAEKFRVQMRRGKEVKNYSTAFAKAYALSLKNSINNQLLASSSLIADFWYTAWVDAGKPDLSNLVNNNAEKQSSFVNEYQLFQQNQLIKTNKLLAKKDAAKEGE
jgi:hypothetical protein